MRVVRAQQLPVAPLDAAAEFFAQILPEVRSALKSGEPICVRFDTADYAHHAWRRAAIQELAREAAPLRVNGVAGSDGARTKQMLAYLGDAPGVTGQYLAAHDEDS